MQVNGNRKLQMGVKVRNKLLLREAVELYTKVRLFVSRGGGRGGARV